MLAAVTLAHGVQALVCDPHPNPDLLQLGPAVEKMKDKDGLVVVKSQILAGGRGLGTFTNGLQARRKDVLCQSHRRQPILMLLRLRAANGGGRVAL